MIEGTLAYISPEQTGRTSRVVDWRSDLYSLGATFYELLAGRPPWTLDDAGDSRARAPGAHAAARRRSQRRGAGGDRRHRRQAARQRRRRSVSVGTRTRARPRAMSRVARARRAHRAVFARDARRVGPAALSFAPLRPRARTSRAARRVQSHSRLGRASWRSSPEIPASESRRSFTSWIGRSPKRDGLFIEGKFDQLRRSVPYSALEQAFRQFVDTLLTEPNAAFTRWRDRIADALGASSAALLATRADARARPRTAAGARRRGERRGSESFSHGDAGVRARGVVARTAARVVSRRPPVGRHGVARGAALDPDRSRRRARARDRRVSRQ